MPNLSTWERRHWLTAITVMLTVTLTPLGWIQWQQLRMLDEMSTNQVDSIMWQAYQLERELSRLDQVLIQAEREPASADPYELQARYEVFLSRIDLMTRIPRRDLLEDSLEYQQAIGSVRDFTTLADPLFAQPERLATSPASIALVDQAIQGLLPQLSELTRQANRAVARFLDERNSQLQQQSRLVIALAAIQCVVMLLFVGLLVGHIRRQQQQYSALQSLNAAVAEARDQAEAANRGKSVFLANMSHEIRTPFQGLLGMLNLMDEPNLTGHQRDYLQTARDSALHLLGVLNDILDVSTMESGTLKLSVAPVHVQTVVQEVDGLMQVAARDKGLELDICVAPDLPTWVEADATRLRQILFNLINNAIKFTPAGEVRAELRRRADGAAGVEIWISDTGVGMDPTTVSQLFTRFYQADNSLRRRIGGTGLGLEISRNLARMMGGDIEVISTPGVGSVFTVSLALTETDPPEAGVSSHMGLAPSRNLRVLVAEDHPINLKYMSILLQKMGHDATFCENGEEALQLLASLPFDVVLLDYHMPLLDGLATTEAIRRLGGSTGDIPVILVTADVVNDTRKRALEVGVSEFASKPLQADELKRVLRRCGLLDPTAAEDTPARASSAAPLSASGLPVRLQRPIVPSEVVIDAESYREILSMMPDESMNEMLETLFEPPEGTLHVLLAALKGKDRADIQYNAHKLKGTAMLLGFRAIVKTAELIEQLASDREGPPLPTGLDMQLIHDMEATQLSLRQFESVSPI
jgi:signal transduction histidine kinase/FixJ family two-component response regulator/HPt (histidine-containing phosphotransfer) domain-containing protein